MGALRRYRWQGCIAAVAVIDTVGAGCGWRCEQLEELLPHALHERCGTTRLLVEQRCGADNRAAAAALVCFSFEQEEQTA